MKPICKLVETSAERDAAFSIREIVFISEQNVPADLEWDEYDSTAVHMICKIGDKAVGVGRLSFFGADAKVERVAVLKQFRNQGIGTDIVKFQIEQANKRDAQTIYANVQLIAQKFYSKLGFCPVGEIFDEAGIDHIKMVYAENKK